MRRHTIDFTNGAIIKQLILFAIPIIMGELLQNLYNSVDSMVVGNFVGKSALAAVSACSPISRLVVNFFNGLSVGGTVVTGLAFGAGNPQRLSHTKRSVFSFSVLLGVAVSLAGILLTPVLLHISAVPENVFDLAQVYLRIYLAGALFTVTYNIAAGILRAIGDSNTPFVILSITCSLNAVLDLLFVIVFHWGLVGAATATVIAQAISLALAYRAIRKSDRSFALDIFELRQSKTIISGLVSIGIPAGMQSAIIAVSNIFIWRYVNGFGEAVIAGVGAEIRIEKLVTSPASGFSHAVTTFISQNEGAEQHDRAKKGCIRCLMLATVYTASACIILSFFSGTLARLFSNDRDVISVTVEMMHVMVPFYIILVLRDVVMGILRGYGASKVPMVINLIGMVVLRQLYLSVIMRIAPTVINLFYCYPISWMITLIMLLLYYIYFQYGRKRRGKNN